MAREWRSSVVALVLVQAMAGGCAAPPKTGEGEALLGTWSCRSAAQTISTIQFSRASDGSISMSNRYATKDGETGEFDETYVFDPKNEIWTWSTTDSLTGSKEQGTAGRWTGRTWTFDGTRVMRTGGEQKIQMTYTRLNDREFRRDFLVTLRGVPITTSSSVCKLVKR